MTLQEVVKNVRVSDTILENSPKGDSQSNGAAENAAREAEGMIRTWKVFVQDKLNIVIDNKHVLLPWLVSHAGVIITRYKKVHDGKTAYQKIKNNRPSNKMMPFGEKVVLDDAQRQPSQKQAGANASIWSFRWDCAENWKVCRVDARRSSTCSQSSQTF